MQVSEYKSTSFLISQNGFGFICNCKGVTPEPDAVLKNPNNSFSGIIVASLAYNSVDYLDLTNSNTINTFYYDGKTKVSFKGKSLHMENVYDALFNTIDYPVVEIKDYQGNTLATFAEKGKNGKQWQTGAYGFGVLSMDGSKFIISGKTRISHSSGPYSYIEYKDVAHSVIDATTGNEIKFFTSGTQGKWAATWLQNGGIILPNTNGGIDITDANLVNKKTIYTQAVNFARCSPDGKKILFQKGSQLFTINTDGTNETRFTNKEVELDFKVESDISDVCWSSDGKAIALTLPDATFSKKYYALLLAVDGKKASMLKDKFGKRITFTRPFISWIDETNVTSSNTPQIKVDDNEQTEINISNKKVTPNPYLIYKPTTHNTQPAFTKAWEIYTQVMQDDLENFNDIAAAITYVVSLNYMHLNNISSISTPTTEKIYNQIATNLLQVDDFKKTSNSDKQMMTEQIVLDGLETMQVAATKDQQKIKECSIRLMKKYIGKNAEKMKVTDNGMEF
jgi:hypothetical protein